MVTRWGVAEEVDSSQSTTKSLTVEKAPAMKKNADAFSLVSIQPAPAPTPTPAPIWQSYLFPSIAATVVTPFTNPFGVAKTQMQAKGSRFRGMGDFFRQAIAKEGLGSLQRGILPVAMREASMNVFRIGLYTSILGNIHNEEQGTPAPSWKRMVAGAWSGAVGFFACNPFEMVRVKMMAQPIGSPVSSMHMASKIFEEQGIGGFYKAGGSSVALGMVCTSVNLTTYTLFHESAVEEYGETMAVDMSCALASGFLAALAMNPIDVIRTRLWTQPSPPIYRGGFHACADILRNEGGAAFFKGFVPSFLRIGPHFVLTFMLLEQMRRMAKRQNTVWGARDDFLTDVFDTINEDHGVEIHKQELAHAIRWQQHQLYQLQ